MCGTALRFINQMHLSDKKAARLAVRQAGSGSWRRARTDRRLQQIVKITLKSVAVRKRKTFYCTGLAAQVARHRIFIFITAQHFRSVTNARNCPPNSDSISIFQSSHRIESAQIFLLCHLQSHSILRSPLDSSLYTFIQLINGPLLIRTAGYGLPPPLPACAPSLATAAICLPATWRVQLQLGVWGSRWAQFTRLKISDSRKPKHRQQTRNAR